jgi:hypothetical protein
MKTRIAILIASLAFLLSSCLIKSLHPFFKEKDVVFKKELIGTWLDQDSGKWVIAQTKIQSVGGLSNRNSVDSLLNNYSITFTEKNQNSTFLVHLFSLNNQLYVDFFPDDIKIPELIAFHLVRAHSIAKIDVFNDSISLKWFNEIWLAELFENNKIRIAHETIVDDQKDETYVLTASTEELQKFLIKYGNDPKAFTDSREILCYSLKRIKE